MNESKNKVKFEDKEKNKEKEKDKEKDKEKEKENKNKNINENNEDENIDPEGYLSNPTIQFALESGFSLKDAVEGWSLFYNDKESLMEYLLNKKNYMI